MSTSKKTGSAVPKRSVSSSKSGSASRAKTTQSKSKKAAAPQPAESHVGSDILGILICAFAVALFLAVVSQSDAVVTKAVSNALHYGLGIGAYVVPFPLLIWGISFFLHGVEDISEIRLLIGLIIILLALVGIFAICALEPDDKLSLFFTDNKLVTGGGYIGSGIAWLLVTLVGRVIALVILVAFILVGLVVFGFSISGLIQMARDRYLDYRERKAEEVKEATAPRARVEKGDSYKDKKKSARDQKRRIAAAETRQLGTGDYPLLSDGPEEGRGGRDAAPATMVMDDYDDGDGRDQAPATSLMVSDEDIALESEDAEGGKKTRSSRKQRSKAGSSASSAASVPQQDAAGLAPLHSEDFKDNAASTHSPKAVWRLPDYKLLKRSGARGGSKGSQAQLQQTAQLLQETLDQFNVAGRVVGWVAGPQATLYKIELQSGVRLNRISNLSGDIALKLAAQSVRIVAPIPKTSLVGIEVPNSARASVLFGDILPTLEEDPTLMLMAIGKDVEGNPITADMASMPHLLVAGTTGSGKSVAVHSFIMSLLMRTTPDQLRMILIDPKRVEFTSYNGIPHLYVPVVTDAEKAASALAWCVAEMERRLKVFEKAGARNIGQYNEMVSFAQQQAGEDDEDIDQVMPRILVVIDELADLMMVCGKDVENSISRISQLARAAGIHLILATQRPSTNVLTGLIKANITCRIALTVGSGIDSRVIIDTVGAEKLIGMGDMLFSKPEYSSPLRIQGCFVSDAEINKVVKFLQGQGEPDYHDEIMSIRAGSSGSSSGGSFSDSEADDPLLWEAAEIVVSSNLGSTSALQRRLKVGYARAGRIMDMLEEHGIVGPQNGSKPREVLCDEAELAALKTGSF